MTSTGTFSVMGVVIPLIRSQVKNGYYERDNQGNRWGRNPFNQVTSKKLNGEELKNLLDCGS